MMQSFGSIPPTDPPRQHLADWYERPKSREGEYVAEHLQLRRFLGKGGYSAAYLAQDQDAVVPREVVVKLLYLRPAENPIDKLRRFMVEIAALDVLGNDPGFVTQVERGKRPHFRRPEDIGANEANQLRQRMLHGEDYFIVVQYMEGGTLWERISRTKGLSSKKAVEIIIEVGSALMRMHQRGLLHRDINPTNIMFDSADSPKLIDLGLARFTNKQAPQAGTVPSLQPPGTPGYIPPESYYGQDTVARDIYALGITFVETLTGPLSIQGNANDPRNWRTQIVAALDKIRDQKLQAIAAKAVAENPARRYSDMGQLVKALQDYQNSQIAVPTLKSRRSIKWPTINSKDVWHLFISRLTALFTHMRRFFRSLPKVDVNTMVARLKIFDWQNGFIGLAMAVTLNVWLTTWPEFYGTFPSRVVPLMLGFTSLFAPVPATVIAILILLLLWFSLSPIAGLIGIVLFFILRRHWCTLSASQRSSFLLAGWAISTAPRLIQSHIALALPLALAISNRSLRKGALAGMSTFLLLNVWAIFQGANAFGPTAIFIQPSTVSGGSWWVDTSVVTFLNPSTLVTFVLETFKNWRQITLLTRTMYSMWTAINPYIGLPLALIGAFIWGFTGFVAALITKHMRKIPGITNLRAVFLSTGVFVGLQWLLLQSTTLNQVWSVEDLAMAGTLICTASLIPGLIRKLLY